MQSNAVSASEQRWAMIRPLFVAPARKKPVAKRMRAICSQKMRRRISGPKARRARAAPVAVSMKAQRGSAQAKSAIATGSRSASSGAAEKKPATAWAFTVMSRAMTEAGRIAMISDSFTTPWAAASSRAGTTRWSATGMEMWMKLTRRLTAAQSAT